MDNCSLFAPTVTRTFFHLTLQCSSHFIIWFKLCHKNYKLNTLKLLSLESWHGKERLNGTRECVEYITKIPVLPQQKRRSIKETVKKPFVIFTGQPYSHPPARSPTQCCMPNKDNINQYKRDARGTLYLCDQIHFYQKTGNKRHPSKCLVVNWTTQQSQKKHKVSQRHACVHSTLMLI